MSHCARPLSAQPYQKNGSVGIYAMALPGMMAYQMAISVENRGNKLKSLPIISL